MTTTAFSICLNGSIHGFFPGAGGLRQGDPMSPYLFVLVMEVLQMLLSQLIEEDSSFGFHWKCHEIGLFQLCFVDDLLLSCNADEASVLVFQRGLQEFANLSGLQANPAKSQLILSKSAHGNREALLQLLGFQQDLLPVQYLGLPLILSQLKISNCQPLLCKTDKRLKGWEGVGLPFAGSLQLIKSVIMAFHVNSDTGYAKVAWNQVCSPLDEGGLGIRDVQALNYALMSKHLWAVISNRNSSIWVQWVRQYYIRHKIVWMVNANADFWCWRKLLQLRVILQSQVEYRIGDGVTFSIWLSTMDKPRLSHLDGGCSLCTDGQVESHSHLFFNCRHSRHCIAIIRRQLQFPWPNEWGMDITWAARRWRGKHVIDVIMRYWRH
ncbi:UNVERIFIED_CONTAM: hypothetical protein Scaly_1619900 [Sesamum calycinum]|uniref:Reverse transcriptase domain-containing protein n=1 Tax=Sesamum calycinum TaxID=2727403 RepID=A0AAW2P8T8_9LAMI